MDQGSATHLKEGTAFGEPGREQLHIEPHIWPISCDVFWRMSVTGHVSSNYCMNRHSAVERWRHMVQHDAIILTSYAELTTTMMTVFARATNVWIVISPSLTNGLQYRRDQNTTVTQQDQIKYIFRPHQMCEIKIWTIATNDCIAWTSVSLSRGKLFSHIRQMPPLQCGRFYITNSYLLALLHYNSDTNVNVHPIFSIP